VRPRTARVCVRTVLESSRGNRGFSNHLLQQVQPSPCTLCRLRPVSVFALHFIYPVAAVASSEGPVLLPSDRALAPSLVRCVSEVRPMTSLVRVYYEEAHPEPVGFVLWGRVACGLL
jgi:hypothetical protein